ncbi:hypothetical protein LG634_00730 [Streptomyces bambusae]|uniref:sensor histidine kinase n=1 Tax=Streptomyces bambusae TaxID=1550616 RepID=UPI001CFDF559|nr:ATP-binding protein [Streptomyces bambusae]MCB5163378.1 hypothetical protein [Streptomyces bambusae]
MAVGSGLQRAQRFMILATALYRGSHLTMGAVAAAYRTSGSGLVAWGLFAVAVASSLVLYATAHGRGWFARRWVWTDVVLTGCVLPLVAVALAGGGTGDGPPAERANAAGYGWLFLLGGSSSAAAGTALGVRWGAAAVGLLLATPLAADLWMAGTWQLPDPGTLRHLNSVAASAVMCRVFWWYLRRQGSLLDAAVAKAVSAEAQRARQAERMAHHRALHDTVLATLTTIASGQIDANAPQVRERCAREAAYLRRLVQVEDQAADPGPGEGPDMRTQTATGERTAAEEVSVTAALEEAVRSAECLGLKVTAQYHAVPEVPGPVAAALAAAVTEALNNVRRHAGTGHAYLTATGTGPDGAVRVTVVDRGAGFDPAAAPAGTGASAPAGTCTGTGLRRSIHVRLAAAGGRSEVDSAPGEGTRVELRWPA